MKTTMTMIRSTGAVLVTLAATVLTVPSAQAQDFEWRGGLDQGEVVEVHGVNGRIDAVAGSGRQVIVTAEMREGSKGRVDDVRIEVVEHAGGVVICAMYPNRPGRRENRCAPGDTRLGNYENNTRVDFRIEVPAGVDLVAGTVNGDVEARRIDGDVKASTVNGDIEVESGGTAEASTVNGSIRASMASDLAEDLRFKTVNGSVTVSLPSGANADVEAATVNGSLESDFPLTVRGRFSNRRMHGTIGDGGHALRMETVNGSVTIRRI
ncbi:MAG TPA: DUF4097 family beta strand repeat-containing protein [Gemmatimonadota bacterium]|nr:DUF4097 family beta strand repeat-containing protein [Gemmatimonadota bacterium]